MRKIMFNDRFWLTEAVLTGRKTMTRRIVKCPKKFRGEEDVELEFHKRLGCDFYYDCVVCNGNGKTLGQLPLPYQVGEIVAVAQSYRTIYDEKEEWFGNAKANSWWCEVHDQLGGLGPAVTPGYRNKLFVRSEFMPHHICFTDLKFERLQDISDEDCLAEGIYFYNQGTDYGFTFNGTRKRYATPKEAFRHLMEGVSRKGIWKSNPWVAAYTFGVMD